MNSIINRYGDCASDLIGSGSRYCDFSNFGDLKGIVLFKKNWSLNIASGFTLAQWKDEMREFNAIPYLNVFGISQDTPENDRATSSTGIMTTIRQGKPQLSATFIGGGCQSKSLYDKRGQNRWDLGLIFEKGILVAVQSDGDTIEGFDMSMFDVGTMRFQQDADPQQTTITMQIVDADQLNMRWAFLRWDNLGFDLSKVEGVIQAQVSYATEPAVGDSEIVVQVANSCNYDDTLAGFDGADFWRLAGTQSVTITGVTLDTDTSLYTIALSGALVAGTVQPVLSTEGVDVVEIEGDGLYKGKGSLVTLTEPTT